MGRLIDVAAAGDVADGAMAVVSADGKELLLARVGSEYFAADARCPHMGAQLAEGRLEDTVVVCPRHGSRFDLRDGRALQWTEFSGLTLRLVKALRSPRPLRTYPVQMRDGRVLVDLETAASD